MAIITEEEPDSPTPQLRNRKPNPTAPPPSTAAAPTESIAAANPFHFWFYATVIVSLTTLSFVLLSSLSPQDPKSWFLNLPPILRHHYSAGRTIKVQTAPNQPQIEVFTVQHGPVKSDEHVLIVHGLGSSSFGFRKVVEYLGSRNVHAVAVDLPGSGFSDKSVVVDDESPDNGNKGLWEVYEEIKEKGLFWGFDQLVEQGYVDFQEKKKRVVSKAIELDSEEMGKVLGQVIDSMGLAPVDLVLHDTALGLSANWIQENRGLVRSVVVLDGFPKAAAFPLWALEIPVVREVVLGFRVVFERVLENCCVESGGGVEADSHRILLKGRDGRRAVVGMGKKLNLSFDLSEWGSLDSVKGLPIKVIWSDKWISEGRWIADVVPQATFGTHSGGRWPQELNSEEISEKIYEFVSSLPKSTKQAVEEPIPEHIEKMFSEAKSSDHHHHHHHHGYGGHGHDDGHGHGSAAYMDAYGLGQGLAM